MTQSPVLLPDRTETHSPSESSARPKFLIGTGAVAVACAALGAIAFFAYSSSFVTNDAAVSTTAPAAPVAALPRVADRWYEDTTRSRIASTPRVADRWYEEHSIGAAAQKPALSAPPVHDAWYLDLGHSASTRRVADRWFEDTSIGTAPQDLSTPPVHDAWYLDLAASQTTLGRIATTPRVADRWYEDTTPSRIASTPRVADRWYEDTAVSGGGQSSSEDR
jgi:hypothetical protein